ncbi:S1C family serine protease [Patescibacteria group bacterium]
MNIKKYLILVSLFVLITAGLLNSGLFGINWKSLNENLPFTNPKSTYPTKIVESQIDGSVKVVTEESVIIAAVEKVSPSVVTIGITKTSSTGDIFEIDPFNPIMPFRRKPGEIQDKKQDIGSGFIVSPDGLVVTNKHVVGDTEASYRVITKDDKTYDVEKIFRDPINDLAILKINASELLPIEMGDSDKIKVGQMAIAIGTALGEFRNTVTTGVISGVGRGITAGSPFEGYAERLDNVIQTDAAINFGNSGGPLLNSSGQVIGINTAVSSEGQNIGFALPINMVKEALNNFNKTGQFDRPFLGVRYKIVTRDIAILNEVPEGVYLIEVIEGSAAENAGLAPGDILTKLDGKKLTGDDAELSQYINQKKPGETIKVTVWRDDEEKTVNVTLGTQE